jgi:DEAD/DEAH box helicase domain-containing protein
LSEKVFEIIEDLLTDAEQIINHCGCESGCPSCVGMEATGEDGKQLALKIIELFRGR